MRKEQHLLADKSLALGISALGNLYKQVSDEAARETIDAAWECGLRYFDTAPFYGFGLSERRGGDALRDRARDDYVLSTKVGRRLRPELGPLGAGRSGFQSPMPFDSRFDYSYDGVMRSFEDSLQRLGLARVDLLLMHDLGRMTHGEAHHRHLKDAVDGGFRAMQALKEAGAVAAIGLGVNEVEICVTSLDCVEIDYFLLANRYTLLEQSPLEGFFDLCVERGARIIAAGVYNSGILATGTRAGGAMHYDYGPASEAIIDRVRAIELICEQHGVPLSRAALQFPGRHPVVCTTLVGMTGRTRVVQTVENFKTPTPQALWDELKHAGLLRGDAP